jgi:hypothetical protein
MYRPTNHTINVISVFRRWISFRASTSQEVLYLGKDLRNGRGLWKPGFDVDRCAIDLWVSVFIMLCLGNAPRMTGGLVEPSLEELAVLELEHLDLASKTGINCDFVVRLSVASPAIRSVLSFGICLI